MHLTLLYVRYYCGGHDFRRLHLWIHHQECLVLRRGSAVIEL